MNKKVLIFGLAGIMLTNTLMTVNVIAEDVKEEKVVTVVEQEIMSLSLEEAIEYALENSKDMEIQRLELSKADIAYEEGIRDVKKTEQNVDEIFDRDPLSGMTVPDAAINKTLVESGVSRRSVVLAHQVAKWKLELKENQVKYDVEKAYFDLLQKEKELLISKENFELSQKQYDHAKQRYELGMISKQQLLGLELGLLQAQSMYDTTNMLYNMQLMSFQNTLGLPFDKDVKLTDTLKYKEYEKIDLVESTKLGLKNNVGIKIAEENYELSKLNLKAISIKYPKGTYRYSEKAVETEKSAKNLETAKNGVEMGVKSAYLNLQNAEKQIKIFEKAVEQAKEAVRIAELSFDLGKTTSTDINQANINLMDAKKNLSQQIHANNLALLDYEYSIGIGKGM